MHFNIARLCSVGFQGFPLLNVFVIFVGYMMTTYERHRAYIHSHLLEFEKNITDFKTYSRAQVQQILKRRRSLKAIPPQAEGRWTYIPPTEFRDSESESEPESKRQKVELSPDEVCVICLEKRKTHAFLHANIVQVQWLLLRNFRFKGRPFSFLWTEKYLSALVCSN